ncbi:MAG TPA: biopolymer transporter ExbD [Thermoanaerobaculia bacterium]|nr:biopolymer transporter ExbD [Thermoanaerobaculia bacterium]
MTSERWSPERWLNLFGTVCATFLLVLCIVLMTITPIVPLPIFIDFPTATSAGNSPEQERDTIVSIRSAGETYVQSREIDRRDLARELGPPALDRTLRIRADREAPFGSVRAVVVAAQAAGYRRVVIMVRNAERLPPQRDADEWFTLCADCGFGPAGLGLAMLVFAAPVGAVVMRRHIASATGGARLAGRALQVLAALSLPPVFLMIAELARKVAEMF